MKNLVHNFSNVKISNLLENETSDVLHKIDIENIDNIVHTWKFRMCVKCAIHCKGDSLYNLYLSSKNCSEKKHAVSKRTSSLKGYGKLCAAVEYINATIQCQVNDLFEAEYYAKNAIKC